MSGAVLISTAEFALKSQPVRQQLVRLLKRHVRLNLKRVGQEEYRIKSAGGLLVVDEVGDAESAARDLARIFGVSHADACVRIAPDLGEIVECAARLAVREVRRGETFAVRARNFEPSTLKRREIEIRVGSEILSRLPTDVRVNLTSPGHTIRVFYGAKDAYVSATRYNGPGGLPVGSQGSLLGLATDPAYSSLAFYLLMKRGATVWPVIADLPPPIGGVPPDNILQGLKTLRSYVPKNKYSARLIQLDENTRQTLAAAHPRLQRILLQRLLVRVVKHLSRTALGLVTADRIGHDGLESLKDLGPIDQVAKLPIYRPLLTLEEEHITRELEQLGLARWERAEPSSPSPPYERIIEEIRKLEDLLKVEQLAQQIAMKSEKIPL